MGVTRDNYPVPNVINIFALFCSITLAVSLLILCSYAYRSAEWLPFALFAVMFSFVNNTNFSLLHESVHGIMNSNRRVNYFLGCVTASFFPTSFTLQQFFHLGHHCRNRTDAEMFDLYYPHDNVWMKRLIIYAMPSGCYWLSVVAGNSLFLTCPWLLRVKLLRDSSVMKYSSFESMLSSVPESTSIKKRIRLEILLTVSIQAGMIYFFDISLVAWIFCYWLFGMNWGSLQYTDHAYSKRDVRNGAWNLRVNPISRLVFLNYHLHLAHHQFPFVPWIYLPQFVGKDEKRPLFWTNFFRLMCGPYPSTEPAPTENRDFAKVVYRGTSMANNLGINSEDH